MTTDQLIALLQKYPAGTKIAVAVPYSGSDDIWAYLALKELDDGFMPSGVVTLELGEVMPQ